MTIKSPTTSRPDRHHRRPALLVRLVVLGALILAAAGATVSNALAQEAPTVRAVMFWSEGCGHCDWIKAEVLPPLARQYGDQWQLELIELRSAADFDRLFQMGTALGVPRSKIGVPFLLIGDDVLIGSNQIPAELPGLIQQHLAAGGVGWPATPGLETFLPEAAAAISAARAEAPAPESNSVAAPTRDGFLLATLILIGMVLALGYTARRLWQARRGRITTWPAWTENAFPLLALLGLGVAAYLAYVETQAVAAICGPIGECNAVQSSEYAYLFGIPIGVLGVVGYIAILAAWGWRQWREDPRATVVLVGLTGFGVLFSIYLTYLEPFVIGAVCAWCLTSAVVMTLLLLLSADTAAPQLEPQPVRRRRKRR